MLPTKLSGNGFYFRKLKKSDAESIYQHVKDKEICRYTKNIPSPYHKKDAISYIKKSVQGWKKGVGYAFGIVIDEKVVGVCGLAKVDKKNRSAELGYWLGKKYWGQGITTAASRKVLEFGFKQLKLHRVSIMHLEENIASRKVIEKLGFHPEGLERDRTFRFGRWHNLCWYGMLEEEYRKLIN